MYRKIVKRCLDIFVAGIAIVLLALPMLFIAIAIKIDDPGPAVFKQERVGLGGKVFRIYKFRSMRVNAEHTGSGVYSGKGDPRVTRIGKLLRSTSLDELPQFFNIIRGDMSFVGPRPPLTYHPWTYDKYTDEQRRMFEVRPGVTGWAQIHGRKNVEWNERIKLNVWYVNHVSLGLDLKILFKTVFKVLISADNVCDGPTVLPEESKEKHESLKGE